MRQGLRAMSDLLDPLEQQAEQDYRELQGLLARLDPRVTPEPQDLPARLVRKARRACLARWVRQATRARADRLAQREHRALVELLARKG